MNVSSLHLGDEGLKKILTTLSRPCEEFIAAEQNNEYIKQERLKKMRDLIEKTGDSDLTHCLDQERKFEMELRYGDNKSLENKPQIEPLVLESLDVSSNIIKKASTLELFTNILCRFSKLSKLILAHNPIGDSGLRSMVHTFTGMKDSPLEYIDLTNC